MPRITGRSSTAPAVAARTGFSPTIAIFATLPIALILWVMIILAIWGIFNWATP